MATVFAIALAPALAVEAESSADAVGPIEGALVVLLLPEADQLLVMAEKGDVVLVKNTSYYDVKDATISHPKNFAVDWFNCQVNSDITSGSDVPQSITGVTYAPLCLLVQCLLS